MWVRSRVLDEFVLRHAGDPRWTAMVLDLDRRMVSNPSRAAERALYHLSRRAPAAACETVATAAASITAFEATEWGLLALTTLGDRCRPALRKLAGDAMASPEARGGALEILGALGDPELARFIDRAGTAWRPAVERARVWLGRRGR